MTLLFPKLDIATIFDKYDKEDILSKLRTLKYFSFLRGRLNSYVEDSDELVVHFSFDDKLDLVNKLTALGVFIKYLQPSDPTCYDKNISYELSRTLPNPIKQFPDIAQPLSQNIIGFDVFIIVAEGYFSLCTLDKTKNNWHFLSGKDFEIAREFEIVIEKSGLQSSVTDEFQKAYGRYINRYHYPELFS